MKIHLRPKRIGKLFWKAVQAWSNDYAPSMGAAISYYTVFSIAPLLVIVIAIAGAVFGEEAVSGAIVAQVGHLIGEQGATLIQSLLAAASDEKKGAVAGAISVLVLLIGATSVFAELQNALDRIWHVPPSQKPQGIWGILRARILSFGMILGLVFLLMVSLAVSAAVAAFGALTHELMPGFEVLLQVLNMLVSLGIATLLFAMIYKLLPSTRIAWRDVWLGAFSTALLFEVGKFLIGLYIGKSGMTESFAAAGSLVVMLAWVYYAAQIFLLGAEFTKVIAQDRGSEAAGRAMDRTVATAALGVPTEGPSGKSQVPQHVVAKLVETPESAARNVPPRDPAMESPVFRTTEVGLKAALAGLFTEVAALVVVTIVGTVVHKKRRKLEDEMRLGAKDARRQVKRRLVV
jgi:membrane protein